MCENDKLLKDPNEDKSRDAAKAKSNDPEEPPVDEKKKPGSPTDETG